MVGVPQDEGKTVLQKTQEHNQAAYLKQQQIDQQNAQLKQQRQNAPSSIKEGTFEAQQVKKEEAQDAQEAYFQGNFQQKGSTADSFVAQREAALKSGKFDYGAVKSSFYSPPGNFVNTKGERVVRTPNPASEKAAISFGTHISGTPSEKLNAPILKISSSQLQKTNALRASQGLPPLETIATIQIVTPTKGPTAQAVTKISTGGKAPPDLRAKLAQAQGTLQSSGGGGEAVSFLRFPFTPNKGASSGGVQSTTILDPLQFLGIEAGVSLAAKGAKFVGSLIKSEGKTIIKEGSKDIGLNIKPSEAYLKAKSFESQAARLPKPASVKPTATPKTPTVPTFTSTEANLGKGLVRTTGKEGSSTTSLSDKFKPSPPSNPSGAREITVGKGGLTQIVKEKPPIQKQITQMKETQLKLGSGQVKQVTKPKEVLLQKTQAQLKTEDYLKSLQKTRIIPKPRQSQNQESALVYVTGNKNRPAQPRQPQKQKQRTGPVLIPTPPPQKPRTRTIPTLIPITILTGKQGQEKVGITDTVTTSVTRGKTPPPPPPKTTPPPPKITSETPPPDKKKPPFVPLLGGAKPGGLLSVSKSGSRKGYIGNVPLESLVGVYKRSEVTYTNKSPSQLNQKQKISGNRNFKLLGSKSIKI